MEPIERELEERKERRKRLAIQLQTLEAAAMPRKAAARADREAELASLRHRLDLLAWSIEEFEDIIAEGRHPPRIPRPSNEGRRRLSPAERRAIEAKTRADLKDQFGATDVEVHVASVTGPDGTPEVHIAVRSPDKLEDRNL